MSVDYIRCANGKSNVYKYLNDTIIKPTEFLIKQESRLLLSDNDDLRRNNEDLSNRIEQMFQEFDLISISNDKIGDRYSYLRDRYDTNNDKWTVHRINHENLGKNVGQRSTVGRDSKIQMTDNINGPFLRDMNSRDETQLVNNDEERKRLISKQQFIAGNEDIEKQNNSSKNLQKNEIHPDTQSKSGSVGSKSSSGLESPIYLDIFDSPDIASKFANHDSNRTRSANDKMDVPKYSNEKADSRKLPIYSDYQEIKKDKSNFTEKKVVHDKYFGKVTQNPSIKATNPNLNLSKEIEHRFDKLSNEFNEKLDEINSNVSKSLLVPQVQFEKPSHQPNVSKSPTLEMSNISETQKQIIDLLNKNTEVLTSLQTQELSQSVHDLPTKSQGTTINCTDLSLRAESCQTEFDFPGLNSQTAKDQRFLSDKNNEVLIKKIDEQNMKIDNLSETLTKVFIKNDVVKIKFSKGIESGNFDSEVNKSNTYVKETDNSKSSKSRILTSADVPILEALLFNNDSSIVTTRPRSNADESFTNCIHDFQTETDVLKIRKTGSSHSLDENIITMKREIATFSIPQSELESAENHDGFPSLTDNSFAPVQFFSKIPKRITKLSDKKVNKLYEEKIFSNELESSYETLYDPVLSARSQFNDDISAYL